MGSKIYTKTDALSQDQRVAVEGGVGNLVAPGAASGGMGAIVAAPESEVRQTITNRGFEAGDINSILATVFQDSADSRDLIGAVATSAIAGSSKGRAEATEILAATKAPNQTALTAMIPWAAAAVIAFVIWGKK